ncbi:HAD family phosphatase [Robbsia sp. Bb-Pol-6]|uniref:phosphoglycolate phosphatase n=1 Tax=Robbsia betulipollinis TaxID=2981849 RepID=A0ABT3ZQ83_9BURK|nr:HAD family phosphatase [Robbsia betulipollinis]MCY0388724.1 HAD family phosphatase [Robbsia betulipollinis]
MMPTATATGPGPITHVVCDCDGVLVDSEAVAYAALVDALRARLHHPALAEAVQDRLGLTIETLIAEVAAETGDTLSAVDIATLRESVEDAVRHHQTAVPGIAAALGALTQPVAVASNSSLPRVREAVARCGIGQLVGERIYTADVVGAAKPAPGVYLAACAGFGAPPGACLAVEDSVAGVTAAARAGLRVLGFAGGTHITAGPAGAARLAGHIARLRQAGAQQVFDDMRALPAIVRALSRGEMPGDANGWIRLSDVDAALSPDHSAP